ncbi:carbohydrate ABC transporter substrate-binding protein (CUT1 family) [Hydrogenispora ethanolica]|uniref:Carbohydrate ABC transporter substrate-binding protein (CUT1 family) n=1 Tax=Hydrogenispora ethanolica TaxID=1082276 RepID=A0A4R1RWA6_HYDET|nr:sugar ABC transporter substrate-binding protein [Hydrogenispora ethanolica]TCL70866.1 carbohydrate ABC transporter substrate-binding protein (CUT1 family) [Hydrogenispora ethanolica]
MRRFWLMALVLLVALSSMSVLAAPKVTLRYALWDSNQQPAMEASIKEFMKRNPNIDVKVELTEWTDYWTKITTGVASGTLPDVFWGHLAYFSGLITKGALADLTPMIKKDKIDLSIYYKSLVGNWNYKGKQYGIPKDWDTIAIFYNKNLLDKAHVPYPSEDWSWNPKDGGEFLQVLQKLTIDANGKNATEKGFDKNKVAQYGFGEVAGDNMQGGWLNFVWMNGGTGVLNKPYGDKFVLDQPKAVETLQFWGDLVSKYGVAPSTFATQTGSANAWELFTAQKIAMVPEGSWMLSAARANLKFNWDVALLPKGPAGRYSCFNGLAHNIYAKTKHLKEAWRLVKWMDGYESQQIVSKHGVVFPAISKLMPVYLEATKSKGPAHIQYFIDETAKTGLWPMHVNWNPLFDIIGRELNTAFSGSITAKEAIQNIKAQVQPLLKP